MAAFAFPETGEAADELTRLFDFVWPTAVALWNMRWQIEGFLKVVPTATYEDAQARFVVGSDLHRADIRNVPTNSTWDEEKSRFAEIVLTNAFAIYESWARRLVERAGIARFDDRDLARSGRTPARGLRSFIAAVNANPSDIMSRAFKPKFIQHRKFHLSLLDEMLTCFRYFKEIRNCQMHNGRRADQNAVDAYVAFQPISHAAALALKEQLEHYPVALNAPAQLSLRGCVGFCDIILRMMVTIDAELSGSKTAEAAALERLKAIPGLKPTLSSDPDKRRSQVRRMCMQGGLPAPADDEIAREYLLKHRVVMR